MKMVAAASSISTPQIIPIYELIERVSRGELKIPKFQRPYVWSPEDMIELFDSIFHGYPIGSLLIWETDLHNVTSLERLGPLRLRNDQRPISSYVVDGHQRLATLVGVLDLPEDYPHKTVADWRWWIGYDLEEEEFIHFHRKGFEKKPGVVPLRRMIRTAEFAKLARDLARDLPEEKVDILLERADYLNRKLRDYQVPATVMKSASLDDAVNIFARVNQRGRDMTPDQMVSALSFRDRDEGEFDLAEGIDNILAEMQKFGFGGTERKSVLQVVLYSAGLNFTKPAYEKIVDRDSFDRLRPALLKAQKALISAADFLYNIVGVQTDRLLPYASQLVMVSIYMFNREDSEDAITLSHAIELKRWFWRTSFNGWFAGANTTDLRRAAEKMEELAKGTGTVSSFESFFDDRPLRELPRAFDRRNARIRASLVVQILSGQMRKPETGALFDAFAVFDNEGTRDIPYFFSSIRGPLISNPANRVILPGGYGRSVLQLFSELNPQNEEEYSVLRSHFVSAEAWAALKSESPQRFLDLRSQAIVEAEGAFLQQIGLEPVNATGSDTGEAVSDTDS